MIYIVVISFDVDDFDSDGRLAPENRPLSWKRKFQLEAIIFRFHVSFFPNA